jgi:predicted secreted protein
MKALSLFVVSLACLGVSTAQAGTTVDLAAEASRPAANDQVQAVVFVEARGANPALLARQVNQEIAGALQLIRGKAGVQAKSGNQSTYPVYGREQKIEGWQMRSELVLESRDLAAVSELLGELQQRKLAVGQVSQMPSPETRRKVEDEATRDAIRAFQARAEVIAAALGKPWKIKQLAVSQQGGPQPMPVFRAAKAMLADAAPAPLEAGESQLTTTVSGQIELAD